MRAQAAKTCKCESRSAGRSIGVDVGVSVSMGAVIGKRPLCLSPFPLVGNRGVGIINGDVVVSINGIGKEQESCQKNDKYHVWSKEGTRKRRVQPLDI